MSRADRATGSQPAVRRVHTWSAGKMCFEKERGPFTLILEDRCECQMRLLVPGKWSRTLPCSGHNYSGVSLVGGAAEVTLWFIAAHHSDLSTCLGEGVLIKAQAAWDFEGQRFFFFTLYKCRRLQRCSITLNTTTRSINRRFPPEGESALTGWIKKGCFKGKLQK